MSCVHSYQALVVSKRWLGYTALIGKTEVGEMHFPPENRFKFLRQISCQSVHHLRPNPSLQLLRLILIGIPRLPNYLLGGQIASAFLGCLSRGQSTLQQLDPTKINRQKSWEIPTPNPGFIECVIRSDAPALVALVKHLIYAVVFLRTYIVSTNQSYTSSEWWRNASFLPLVPFTFAY